jgi:hypothetical protein
LPQLLHRDDLAVRLFAQYTIPDDPAPMMSWLPSARCDGELIPEQVDRSSPTLPPPLAGFDLRVRPASPWQLAGLAPRVRPASP